jgi:hypothetical protein
MAFKMKKHPELIKVVKELRGAVKSHGKQADVIEKHIDSMDNSPMNKKGPCWEGYEMIGTKKKGGRTVPNCVPKK